MLSDIHSRPEVEGFIREFLSGPSLDVSLIFDPAWPDAEQLRAAIPAQQESEQYDPTTGIGYVGPEEANRTGREDEPSGTSAGNLEKKGGNEQNEKEELEAWDAHQWLALLSASLCSKSWISVPTF